jgi:probable HAF family extracellular repeat protein
MSLVEGGEAFIWQEAQVTPLGLLSDGYFSEGKAINEVGQVVGFVVTGDLPNTGTRPFLWDNGQMIDLGSLPGFESSAAADINDQGQIVGSASGVDGNPNIQAAFVWQNGVMTDLNELIPPGDNITIRVASAINNAGQITGWGTSDGSETAVFLAPINQPPGDLDHDCMVGIHDFLMLLAAWGPCPPSGACPADLDGDGAVGITDFLMMLRHWG